MVKNTKAKGFLVLLLLLLFGTLNAQQNLLIPFWDGQKYGFKNELGDLIITPKYETAYPFFPNHELSMVIYNGKTWIINRKGKKIIEASTDYISETENLNFDKIYKYEPEAINLNSFCLADSCPEFKIFGKLDNNHLFDKMGENYFVRAENKSFLINSKGNVKSKEFDKIRHIDLGEIEYAITEDFSIKKFGLLNNYGETLRECAYDGIEYNGKGEFNLSQSGQNYKYKTDYNQNYKPTELQKSELNKNRQITRHEGKSGIVDSLKRVILPFVYKKLYPMLNDNYLFWKEDSVGILHLLNGRTFGVDLKANLEGVIAIADFVPYLPYTKELAFINNGEYWMLVNIEGKVLKTNIEAINVDFQNIAGNITGMVIGGKLGVVNNNGKSILDFVYDEIFCLAGNNSFVVKQGTHYSWLNSSGNVIFENFDDYKIVLNNYLFVKREGIWFFVHDSGKAFVK